jgi:hypothetical protein
MTSLGDLPLNLEQERAVFKARLEELVGRRPDYLAALEFIDDTYKRNIERVLRVAEQSKLMAQDVLCEIDAMSLPRPER